jgi:hypothetical protein
MSALEIAALVVVGAPAMAYVIMRFGAAGFFKSKRQYDQPTKEMKP